MNGVIIQARMGSTRMPGKTMKKVMGKPLLYYSTFRARLCKYVQTVVVATSTDPGDNIIEAWCREMGFNCFRSSENDVLERYYQAAKEYNIKRIIRIKADCPFIDPEILDMLILFQKAQSYDYVSNAIDNRTWPHGLEAEVFPIESLERARKEADKPDEREHVSPYIIRNREKFDIGVVPCRKQLSTIRLTVDYQEDFEFTKNLLAILIPKYGIDFTWHHIIRELDLNPDLPMINKHRQDIRTILEKDKEEEK